MGTYRIFVHEYVMLRCCAARRFCVMLRCAAFLCYVALLRGVFCVMSRFSFALFCAARRFSTACFRCKAFLHCVFLVQGVFCIAVFKLYRVFAPRFHDMLRFCAVFFRCVTFQRHDLIKCPEPKHAFPNPKHSFSKPQYAPVCQATAGISPR